MSVSLYPHQKRALEIIRNFPKYGVFMEMGLGKTITFLSLIKQKGWIALVVCPLSIIRQAWQKDCEKVELKFYNLWEHYTKRKKEIPLGYDVYVINYERLERSLDDLMKFPFDVVIFDESTYIKNHKAKRTKAAIKLADRIPHVYLSSGNPAPNHMLEYWPQMRCLGEFVLGRNFYAFRNRYFYSYGYGGYQWGISKENQKVLMQRIKNYALFMSKDEWLDLPEKTFVIREVQPDKNLVVAYETMRKHRVAEIGDDVVLSQTKITQILRLREITSGFIQDGDMVKWISDVKIKEVKHLLEEIKGQVFIWCCFRAEAERLSEELNVPYIIGGMPENKKQQLIDEFRSGKHRILIATMGTISHGVTLVNCHHSIYYSLTYSLEHFNQSQDRFHRVGQNNPVTYYLLLIPQTIDYVVYKVLQKKETLQQACLEALKISPKNS